MQNSTGEYD